MGKLQKKLERPSTSIQDLCQWFSEEALGFAGGIQSHLGNFLKVHMLVPSPNPPGDGSCLTTSPVENH